MEAPLIVTLIVALIAFSASMISLYVGIIQNRKTRFINIITSERIKWMEKLRTEISLYCSLCWHYSVSYYDKASGEISIKMQARIDRTGTTIQLLLNRKEPQAKKIIDRIKHMRSLIHKKDIGLLLTEIDNLTIESQDLLKEIWEEVKKESIYGNLKHK